MKYPLASSGWLAYAHGVITERAAANPGQTLSICERYTDAPADIANSGTDAVWSCVVADGIVDFRSSARDDVGVLIVGDYRSCLPLARYDTRDDPARGTELRTLMAAGIEEGFLSRTARDGGIGTMKHVHDALAKVTA